MEQFDGLEDSLASDDQSRRHIPKYSFLSNLISKSVRYIAIGFYPETINYPYSMFFQICEYSSMHMLVQAIAGDCPLMEGQFERE